MWKEFKEFALRGNVVDMAVGIIIGAAFGKIVASVVSDILMPPLGSLIGNVDFSDLVLTVPSPARALKPVVIRYGLFINNLLDFIIVAFCVFMLVKLINTLKKQPAPPAPTEKKCPDCCMMVPLDAKRCGHCTSSLA